MAEIKILIVDDHQIVRDGLKNYMKNDDLITVVGEATDGHEAYDLIPKVNPDVVLTDISMEGMNGIDLSKKVRSDYPDIKVLVLSMMNEHQYIKTMLDVGVHGYLLKTSGEEEIKRGISAVHSGETYYSNEVTQIVMQSMTKRSTKKKVQFAELMPLTEREIEVLKLIVAQHSNPEIAELLFISPRTVDAHKRNLLEKTGAKNVAGLVLYALDNDMVDT